VFQILLTFVASVAMGLEMTALLLVFDRRPLAVRAALGVVAMQGLATALLAPAVFALMRRLPTNLAPAPDET
jgi:cell shape-determining protein MreD